MASTGLVKWRVVLKGLDWPTIFVLKIFQALFGTNLKCKF